MNKMLGLRLICLAVLLYAIWYSDDHFRGTTAEPYVTLAIFLSTLVIMVVQALSVIYEKLEEIHQTMIDNQKTSITEKSE